MKSLFIIWNRGYKYMGVVANDINEAMGVAFHKKHIKKRGGYRKFEEHHADSLGDIIKEKESLIELLRSGKSGEVAREVDGEGWKFKD